VKKSHSLNQLTHQSSKQQSKHIKILYSKPIKKKKRYVLGVVIELVPPFVNIIGPVELPDWCAGV
jgi:hypothetical protein